MIRCEKLALHLKNKNVNQFWKEVRNNSKNSRTVNDQIDGKKDVVDIAEVFFKKSIAISGSNTNVTTPADIHSSISCSLLFTSCQVSGAIKNIKTGIGIDGVHSNHLKFLPENMIRCLTKFYNSCIIHKHLPAALLEGYITPRLKDNNGMLGSSENYREILISTNLFNNFEYMLLPIIKRSVV